MLRCCSPPPRDVARLPREGHLAALRCGGLITTSALAAEGTSAAPSRSTHRSIPPAQRYPARRGGTGRRLAARPARWLSIPGASPRPPAQRDGSVSRRPGRG